MASPEVVISQGFMHFILENKIITMAMAALISDRIHDISNAVFNHIIMPILNVDLDGNGVGDGKEIIDKLKKKKYIIKGKHIGVGEILLVLIKTLIILTLVFISWYLVKNKHK